MFMPEDLTGASEKDMKFSNTDREENMETESEEKIGIKYEGFENCPIGGPEEIQKAVEKFPQEIQELMASNNVVIRYSTEQKIMTRAEHPDLKHMEGEKINAECLRKKKPPEIVFYPAAFPKTPGKTNQELARHAEYVLRHEVGHLINIPDKTRWGELIDQFPEDFIKKHFSKHASGGEGDSKLNEMWADWTTVCLKNPIIFASYPSNSSINEAHKMFQQALKNLDKQALLGEGEDEFDAYDFDMDDPDIFMDGSIGGSAAGGELGNESKGSSNEAASIVGIFEQYLDNTASKTAEALQVH